MWWVVHCLGAFWLWWSVTVSGLIDFTLLVVVSLVMSIEFNVYRLVNESLYNLLTHFIAIVVLFLKNTNKEVGCQDSRSIENCPPIINIIHLHSFFFFFFGHSFGKVTLYMSSLTIIHFSISKLHTQWILNPCQLLPPYSYRGKCVI